LWRVQKRASRTFGFEACIGREKSIAFIGSAKTTNVEKWRLLRGSPDKVICTKPLTGAADAVKLWGLLDVFVVCSAGLEIDDQAEERKSEGLRATEWAVRSNCNRDKACKQRKRSRGDTPLPYESELVESRTGAGYWV
jgi:hypothetical protein